MAQHLMKVVSGNYACQYNNVLSLNTGTSQVIITTIAAVIAAIMIAVFFGFCAYKLKR